MILYLNAAFVAGIKTKAFGGMVTSSTIDLKNETIMGGEIKIEKAAEITKRNAYIKKLNTQVLRAQAIIEKATTKVINATMTLIG